MPGVEDQPVEKGVGIITEDVDTGIENDRPFGIGADVDPDQSAFGPNRIEGLGQAGDVLVGSDGYNGL